MHNQKVAHKLTIGLRTILILGWIFLWSMRRRGESFCPAWLNGSMTASMWMQESLLSTTIALTREKCNVRKMKRYDSTKTFGRSAKMLQHNGKKTLRNLENIFKIIKKSCWRVFIRNDVKEIRCYRYRCNVQFGKGHCYAYIHGSTFLLP